MAQHQQRVGLGHAAQDAGTLRTGGAYFPAAGGAGADHGALKLGAARALANGHRTFGHQPWHGGPLCASQCQQGVARKSIKSHQRRHRVAGQRKQIRGLATLATQGPKGKRPPRTHGDFPERHLATGGQQVARVVGVTHADAAAGDDGVGLFDGGVDGGAQQLGVVGHQAQVDHVHAQPGQRGQQAVAVAVVDLARPQRLAGAAQLVAG